MFCYNCGHQLKDGDLYCEKCGMPVNAMPKQEPAPEPEAPAKEPSPYSYTSIPQPVQSQSNLMGILALVTGLVSFIFGWIPFLTFVPEILAAVFGIVGIVKKQGKGMAIAGLILAVLAFLTTMTVSMFLVYLLMKESVSQFFFHNFY